MDRSHFSWSPKRIPDSVPIIKLCDWILGQQVMLDIQLPPPLRVAPPCDPSTILRHIDQHIHYFRSRWPIAVKGEICRHDMYRLQFHHFPFHQFSIIAAVNREWSRAIQCACIHFGYVLFRACPSLGTQFVAFDVVTIVDSEERFHGITDSDALPNLRCNRVTHPCSDVH